MQAGIEILEDEGGAGTLKKLTIKKIQHKFVAILIATVVVAAVVTGLLGVGITRVSTIKAINHNAVETAKVAALAAQLKPIQALLQKLEAMIF